MMLARILSPVGRWLSLIGAVLAALGIAWLKGQAAGKAARCKEEVVKGTRVARHV